MPAYPTVLPYVVLSSFPIVILSVILTIQTIHIVEYEDERQGPCPYGKMASFLDIHMSLRQTPTGLFPTFLCPYIYVYIKSKFSYFYVPTFSQ